VTRDNGRAGQGSQGRFGDRDIIGQRRQGKLDRQGVMPFALQQGGDFVPARGVGESAVDQQHVIAGGFPVRRRDQGFVGVAGGQGGHRGETEGQGAPGSQAEAFHGVAPVEASSFPGGRTAGRTISRARQECFRLILVFHSNFPSFSFSFDFATGSRETEAGPLVRF